MINYKPFINEELKIITKKNENGKYYQETVESHSEMSINQFIKEEMPTTRFWLMLKLKSNWNNRWDMYIDELKTRLSEHLSGDEKNVRDEIHNIVTRVERSAWMTMPTSFLNSVNIPRHMSR